MSKILENFKISSEIDVFRPSLGTKNTKKKEKKKYNEIVCVCGMVAKKAFFGLLCRAPSVRPNEKLRASFLGGGRLPKPDVLRVCSCRRARCKNSCWPAHPVAGGKLVSCGPGKPATFQSRNKHGHAQVTQPPPLPGSYPEGGFFPLTRPFLIVAGRFIQPKMTKYNLYLCNPPEKSPDHFGRKWRLGPKLPV